jgi:hypothetical protein
MIKNKLIENTNLVFSISFRYLVLPNISTLFVGYFRCFNLVAFGRAIRRWRPTVVKPTEILLQDAWKWVLSLKCGGTHNVMGAVRAALENEEERKHGICVDGLYIFTSGVPDQSVDFIGSYLEESAVGRDLNVHTILFNVDDYDGSGPIAGRWANVRKVFLD